MFRYVMFNISFFIGIFLFGLLFEQWRADKGGNVALHVASDATRVLVASLLNYSSNK